MKGLTNFTSPAYKNLLTEMCKKINVDPETIDFKKEGWFTEHTWTKEQENEYRDWLNEQLYNNRALVREISTLGYFANRKRIESLVDQFILMYGWRTKSV